MIVAATKLIASLLVICVVIWWVDGLVVIDHLSGLSLGWVLVAIIAITAGTASMARRWQVVARHLGIDIGFGEALREYYVGMLINQTVPGGVTGDVARALRARHAVDLKTAALSVVLERLLGQVALLLLLALGFVAAGLMPGGIVWGTFGWLVVGAILVLGGVWWWLSRRNGLLGRASTLAWAMQQRPELVLHACLTVICLVFGVYASARATGTVIPPQGWATLIPLVLVAMLVPLSIAGWGWREGAAAALFPLIGAPASAGVAASITYGGVILIAALPAALFVLRARTNASNLTSKSKGIS